VQDASVSVIGNGGANLRALGRRRRWCPCARAGPGGGHGAHAGRRRGHGQRADGAARG